MSIICAYCETNSAGNSDHVFPKSLGGQDIFMDCVCNQCNNDFSKFERELFQKSLIGLMRSVEGVEGYSKNKMRPAPLKFPEMFQPDLENKIVYEIGVNIGFKHYMRPQFIQVKDKIYIEAGSQSEVEVFVKEFNIWRDKNLIMITKFPSKKGDNYEGVKFILNGNNFETEKIELAKIRKEIIHYNLKKENDYIRENFQPRLFFDDSKALIVRSREANEGIQFMIELLNYCKDKAHFKSFSEKKLEDPVQVSMSFDIVMMQQALVKIGLNALMHYYPETKYNPLLKPSKDYSRFGGEIKAKLDKKIDLLDYKKDIHSVLFYQLNEGLMIRSGLFGGSFSYTFLIDNLFLFKKTGDFSSLEVEFKKSIQNHYLMDECLLNIANQFTENLSHE